MTSTPLRSFRAKPAFEETASVTHRGRSSSRSADGPPDKANCTSGSHEPYGYQGLPEGSVRKGYLGNRAKRRKQKGLGSAAKVSKFQGFNVSTDFLGLPIKLLANETLKP